jgi:hypothetical protein
MERWQEQLASSTLLDEVEMQVVTVCFLIYGFENNEIVYCMQSKYQLSAHSD